jgi:transcriptional regulator CtsR
MGFWVRSEDGEELIYSTRFAIRPNGKGYAIGGYDGGSGWVRLADYNTRDEAKFQLDHMQRIMLRKFPDQYIYDLSSEKISSYK